MLYDRSADVLSCPNEACRDGLDTETNRPCRECEGRGYVMGDEVPESPAWEDLD